MEKLFVEVVEKRFNNLFTPTLKKFNKMGFDYISHAIIQVNGNLSVFFSNLKWAKFYRTFSLEISDPCVQMLLTTNRKLVLWEEMPKIGHKIDVMKERYRICGIKDGFTLYYRYPSKIRVILGLGSKNRDKLLQFLLYPQIYELQGYANKLFNIHNKILIS